jgi:ABC-type glycerol-3-phosphate transport system substrate-binding protein
MLKLPRVSPVVLSAILLVFAFSGCDKEEPQAHGRIVLTYWEKLTGFEADAVRSVVDDFNKSQDRIYVDFSSVSQIDDKFMLATAGGVPPDVAGLWSHMLPVYSESNALMPLDKLAAENGVKREDYIDVVWQLCCHRGHLWALPSTPSSIALVWNKKLFREAGLDPEQPPRSIAELEEFNKKIEKRRPDGHLQTIGFLPLEPDWYASMWGFWFGGELWDGDKTITANSPQNIAAYKWVESYPQRFGADNLLAFRDGFGNFASPQNPFLSGRVAMEIQGSWIYSYIKNYAPPGFEWGVAAFPSVDPEHLKNVAIVESDVMVIPVGAKHPKEAFEFIKYVNTQKVMEKLCLAKLQFSPLKNCSPEFLRNHPNPYIKVFLDLAKSPNARFAPRISTWTEYNNDMRNAVSKIWAGKISAEEALDTVQMHEQQLFDRRQERWNRLSTKLKEEWANQ